MLHGSDSSPRERARHFRWFRAEEELVKRINHKNIVRCYGSYIPPECQLGNPSFKDLSHPPLLMFEYMRGGSLYACLRQARILEQKKLLASGERERARNFVGPVLSVREMLETCLSVARAIAYLHSCGYVHRDIKSDNVLVNREGKVKLGDFGMAAREGESMTRMTGSARWMAPEVTRGDKVYGRAVDVHSFGILMWEVLTGVTPYLEYSPEEAAELVARGELRPEIPPHCPPGIAVLMQQCWEHDPMNRPPMPRVVECLEHFLQDECNNKQRLKATHAHAAQQPPASPAENSDTHIDAHAPLLPAQLSSTALARALQRMTVGSTHTSTSSTVTTVTTTTTSSHGGGTAVSDPRSDFGSSHGAESLPSNVSMVSRDSTSQGTSKDGPEYDTLAMHMLLRSSLSLSNDAASTCSHGSSSSSFAWRGDPRRRLSSDTDSSESPMGPPNKAAHEGPPSQTSMHLVGRVQPAGGDWFGLASLERLQASRATEPVLHHTDNMDGAQRHRQPHRQSAPVVQSPERPEASSHQLTTE